MIRRLRGTVIERTATAVVIDVHGVGYEAIVGRALEVPLGQDLELFVYTHVREDALVLFGFVERAEREVFEMLITVPTIGPVKAMAILDTTLWELVRLVTEGDARRLAKLPGIGKKTAERMVVDLRDKLGAFAQAQSVSSPPRIRGAGVLDDVTSALVNLGFKAAQAELAAEKSVERLGQEAGLEDLVREALNQVSGRATPS